MGGRGRARRGASLGEFTEKTIRSANPIIKAYGNFVTLYRSILNLTAPFAVLEKWSQKAELEIEAGMYAEAFATLAESDSAFLGGGFSEEYVRVGVKLFESIEWMKYSTTVNEFDSVFKALIHALAHLGDIDRVDAFMNQFEKTTPEKNVRFIDYCDMRCYVYWFRENYAKAIEWGERAVALKKVSNVDTQINPEHHLALAWRDSGETKAALEYFLLGNTIEGILGAATPDPKRTGAYYGNIGRCLQFQKKLKEALFCCHWSVQLLEKEDGETRLINQGYARQWIAEVLMEIDELDMSYLFYRSAKEIWEKISPERSGQIQIRLDSFEQTITKKFESLSQSQIDNRVRNMIMGDLTKMLRPTLVQ